MKCETLKRCPFCEGPARVNVQWGRQKKKYYVNIVCEGCGAQSKTFTSLSNPMDIYTDAVAFATTLWNRRPGEEGGVLEWQEESNMPT